ncbi:MAG TPA: IS30 family transposase [Bacteroidia bacterium]|nr:IS30 family transposase [Bacteroidia bacterium]
MAKYERLTFEERVKIETYNNLGWTLMAIAAELNRDKSTISREIGRFPYSYQAGKANQLAKFKAKHHNDRRRLEENDRLYNFVYSHLKKHWSPVQISTYLKMEYANDPEMQISHESIYTYIYLLPRGELKKELIGFLRQKKKSRYSRKGTNDKRGKIPEMISIEERPAEVADRSVAGHWEGDLLMGKGHKSAIGTIVERKTRTVILVKLKNKDATSVRKAFEKELLTLPKQMRKTMTYDQGHEMSEHKLFTKNTKMKVYFCHPGSPWERGTNENTNMLLRDYFPKGTDFSTISRKELKRIQYELNERPRKTLDWKSPLDVFTKEILKKCS